VPPLAPGPAITQPGDAWRLGGHLTNLCVWNKSNGGTVSFYRSKHALVFVWKVRAGRPVSSFGLQDTGRYRTNVWDSAGMNAFNASRDADLAMHPTVKPLALVGKAIRDCSKRADIILDMFGGSGRLRCHRRALGEADREDGSSGDVKGRWPVRLSGSAILLRCRLTRPGKGALWSGKRSRAMPMDPKGCARHAAVREAQMSILERAWRNE
jgi:DNA methylase